MIIAVSTSKGRRGNYQQLENGHQKPQHSHAKTTETATASEGFLQENWHNST